MDTKSSNGNSTGVLTKRVLIADDSVSGRELLKSILDGCGYEVIEAEDGEQVLEKASIFEPHLIILDLQMPKLDGYSTVIAMRKLPAFTATPIIALTATAPEALSERIADAGFTQYLLKPIAPGRLRQCVASLL